MTKAFKKVISMALCLMMLAGVCAVGVVPAVAAGDGYTITSDQTITVESGKPVYFTPEKTGIYSFYSTVSVYDPYVYLYDSAGNYLGYDDDGGDGYNFFVTYGLKAGEKYRYDISLYNGNTNLDVTLVHEHSDSDMDGKCDICSVEFAAATSFDAPKTLDITAGVVTEYRFTAAATGWYMFVYDSGYYSTADVYDSDYNYLGKMYSEVYLIEGRTYRLRLTNDTASQLTDVEPVHRHTDANGDGLCDTDSVAFSSTYALGEKKDVTIPAGGTAELVFTCPADTWYYFDYDSSTNGYDESGVFDANGVFLGYYDDGFSGKAGETYRLRFTTGGATEIYGITLLHDHTDGNGDGICDVCSEEYISTIALGEKKTVRVPAGNERELVFTCEKDGEYEVICESSSGIWGCEIYDSENRYIGSTYDTMNLSAGDVISIRFYAYSSSERAKIYDVTVWHDHTDADSDGICDICSAEISAKIALGEKKTVEIPKDETRELVFTCEKAGVYYFDYSRCLNGTYTATVYDKGGNSLGGFGSDLHLSAGDTATLRLSAPSKEKFYNVYVGHYHDDSNSDNICDICGLKLVHTLSLDTAETVTLPSGEYGVIATFTPAENGEYNFVMDEKLANCYDGLYDSGNNPVAFDTYATLTGGETYTISFYNGSSSDVTGELTATHGHKFDFSSNTCSVCNKQIIFDAEEDKAVSVSIDPWNTAMVRFTPAKSGDFIADYDSKADVYFNGVLDTSGTPVSPVYDDYNGEYAVLTQGEAYYFVFKNYEDSAETVEATISHRHVGAETVVAEPTVACDGLTRLDCATCGESLFAITGYTGIYKSDGTTEDGFEYKIYEKDGVREAAISGYTGTETEITIPAEVEGVPVTAVRGSYYGFLAKNSTVTSVTIPEGIREIGDNAFTAYTALEEVTIPDSVIIIGDGAFYGCVNLKGVTLGKNVAYVGEDAFTTVMDEKDKERSEYYYASVEEYIAPERDMADIEREYFDNMAEDYFGDYSDFSGKPVSSWADVLSVVQEADLDAYNSYFNTGYTDKANLINDLEGEIGFFEGNIGNIDRWKNEIENITQSISDVRNDEGEPIAWVIYNGSEENFAKIGIENNNDELTEARRGVDGKDPAFIITYDANGGEKAPEPQTGFKDVTLTAGEPEYYGYTFLGWAKTNNAAAAEYAAGAAYRLEEDVTFYAVWGAKAATLTYDANGGTNAPAAQNGYGKITLSTSAPSKEGYNFLGWAKTNNATAAEYAPGAEFTLEENTTLYAIWQKIYTLTYDANGGTNAPAAQQGNGEITLSAAKPTRDGYEFLGWAKTNNATAAEYEAGAKLNLTEDTTVYAVWKATFKLPEFSAKSASYNTYVTVSVKLNNVPAGAEVWIDGKKAEVDESGTTYSVEIGQVKATKEVKIEVKQGGATLDEATLTIKVDSNFFSKLISFFSNFLFNLFKWKQVTVKF